jgi:hypothetical protein
VWRHISVLIHSFYSLPSKISGLYSISRFIEAIWYCFCELPASWCGSSPYALRSIGKTCFLKVEELQKNKICTLPLESVAKSFEIRLIRFLESAPSQHASSRQNRWRFQAVLLNPNILALPQSTSRLFESKQTELSYRFIIIRISRESSGCRGFQ